MKVVSKILAVFCFIFVSLSCSAQLTTVKDSIVITNSLDKWKLKSFAPEAAPSVLYNSGYQASKLPIFCKMEHRMQAKSRFPVRIRLGDVAYVNKLESK